MSGTNTTEQNAHATASDEIRVMDLLITLAKFKKRIAQVTIATAFVAVAISLVLPKEYAASTKLLPPQQTQSSAAAILSQLGGIAGAAAAGATGLKNPNDLYVGMLKSRTVGDHLVERFKLMSVYETDSAERARKRLASNTSITSGKDGLITIIVNDNDKKLVAPLANAYADELFRLMKTLAVTDASQRRMFYERQLVATKENLAKAEIALKGNMDTHGVISVDAESRSMVETVARLKAQVSLKEIELTSMRAFLTPSNPEYRRAEEERNSLRIELSKLENGRGTEVAPAEKQTGLENIKLLRELKYQQMLYEAISKQYEVARIDEARDPSIIQVLDPAIEPERKAKPRRALIVALATTIAFFGMVCYAFFVESRRKLLQTPAGAAQWAELRSHLRFRNDS